MAIEDASQSVPVHRVLLDKLQDADMIFGPARSQSHGYQVFR